SRQQPPARQMPVTPIMPILRGISFMSIGVVCRLCHPRGLRQGRRSLRRDHILTGLHFLHVLDFRHLNIFIDSYRTYVLTSVVLTSHNPRQTQPFRGAFPSRSPKPHQINSFSDPYPINPIASIFYKKHRGEGGWLLAAPITQGGVPLSNCWPHIGDVHIHGKRSLDQSQRNDHARPALLASH